MINSNLYCCLENELIEAIQNNQDNQSAVSKLYILFVPFIKGVIIKTSFYPNEIDVDELATADEIIMTNAVKGIQWIRELNGKTYANKKALELTQMVNERLIGKAV